MNTPICERCGAPVPRFEVCRVKLCPDCYGCMPDGRFIRLTKENEKDYVPYVHYDDMVKVVKGIPSLDVAPVIHAHWDEKEDCSVITDIPWSMCSACGSYSLKLPYCAFCGAKMDEGA